MPKKNNPAEILLKPFHSPIGFHDPEIITLDEA